MLRVTRQAGVHNVVIRIYRRIGRESFVRIDIDTGEEVGERVLERQRDSVYRVLTDSVLQTAPDVMQWAAVSTKPFEPLTATMVPEHAD